MRKELVEYSKDARSEFACWRLIHVWLSYRPHNDVVFSQLHHRVGLICAVLAKRLRSCTRRNEHHVDDPCSKRASSEIQAERQFGPTRPDQQTPQLHAAPFACSIHGNDSAGFQVSKGRRLLVRRNPNVQNGPSFVSSLFHSPLLGGYFGWDVRRLLVAPTNKKPALRRKSIEDFRKYVGKFF